MSIRVAGLIVLALATALAPPALAQQPVPVRLVIGQTTTSQDGYFAMEGGFFKKYGLDVQITQMRGGAAEAAAVAGGAADIGDSNTISIATARTRDIPFVAIAAGYLYDANDPNVVIATSVSSPYRSTKDLAGQTVGEPSLGGIVELGISAGVDKSGGDWKTIKYVEIQASEAIPALEQGRIAATALQDPQLTEFRSKVRILTPSYDAISRRYVSTIWFSTSAWASHNPDVVRRFNLALNDGAAWAVQHQDLAAAALEKWLKVKITKLHFFHSDTIDTRLLQPLLDSAVKYAVLPKPLAASDLIYTAPR